jgi:hypothetical protein
MACKHHRGKGTCKACRVKALPKYKDGKGKVNLNYSWGLGEEQKIAPMITDFNPQHKETPKYNNKPGEPIKYRDDHEEKFFSKIAAGGRRTDDGYYGTMGDLYKYYGGMPLKHNILSISKYKPTVSKDPNARYVSINDPEFIDNVKNIYNRVSSGDLQGEEKKLNDFTYKVSGYYRPEEYKDNELGYKPAAIGRFFISEGEDEKGKYISYYDAFDKNTGKDDTEDTSKGSIMGTKPFEIYDRIYLNDKESPKKQSGETIPKYEDGKSKDKKDKKLTYQEWKEYLDANPTIDPQATMPYWFKYGELPARAHEKSFSPFIFRDNKLEDNLGVDVKGIGASYKIPVTDNLSVYPGLVGTNVNVKYNNQRVDNKTNLSPNLRVKYNFEDGGWLEKYQEGGEFSKPYVAKDQADFDYRNQMYNDSLALHNYYRLQEDEHGEIIPGASPAEGGNFKTGQTWLEFKEENKGGKYSNISAPFLKVTEEPSNGKMSEGDYKSLAMAKRLEEDTGGRIYITNPYNSPDIKHKSIDPSGYYRDNRGAWNAKYDKPVQKVLPPMPDADLSKPMAAAPKNLDFLSYDEKMKLYKDSLDAYNRGKEVAEGLSNIWNEYGRNDGFYDLFKYAYNNRKVQPDEYGYPSGAGYVDNDYQGYKPVENAKLTLDWLNSMSPEEFARKTGNGPKAQNAMRKSANLVLDKLSGLKVQPSGIAGWAELPDIPLYTKPKGQPRRPTPKKMEMKDTQLSSDMPPMPTENNTHKLISQIMEGTMEDEYVTLTDVAKQQGPSGAAFRGNISGADYATINLPGEGPRGLKYNEYVEHFLPSNKKDVTTAQKFNDGGTTNKGGLSLVDKREVDAATGKPLKYNIAFSGIDTSLVDRLVKESVDRGRDPYTVLAMAAQESQLGTGGRGISNPLHLNQDVFYNEKGEEITEIGDTNPEYIDAVMKASFDLMDAKDRLADKRGYDREEDEALRLQGWNGWGTVWGTGPMYGLDKEEMLYKSFEDWETGMGDLREEWGINLKENPLYGKKIIDIRDNVIKNSPDIVERVTAYTRQFDTTPDPMTPKTIDYIPEPPVEEPSPMKRTVEPLTEAGEPTLKDKIVHSALSVRDRFTDGRPRPILRGRQTRPQYNTIPKYDEGAKLPTEKRGPNIVIPQNLAKTPKEIQAVEQQMMVDNFLNNYYPATGMLEESPIQPWDLLGAGLFTATSKAATKTIAKNASKKAVKEATKEIAKKTTTKRPTYLEELEANINPDLIPYQKTKAIPKTQEDIILDSFRATPSPDRKIVGVSDREINKFIELMDDKRRLPAYTNKDILNNFDFFKQRINTPEGLKRAEALGLDVKDLQSIQLKSNPNTYGYYRGGNDITGNYIVMPEQIPSSTTLRHELEHGIQNAVTRKRMKEAVDGTVEQRMEALKGTTNLDDMLSKLELRKQATPNKDWSGGKTVLDERVSMQDYYTALKDKQNATDYFTTGSSGKEKSSFAAELQQFMLDKNIIQHPYDNITPAHVKKALIENVANKEGTIRLLDIMKPNDNNYKLVSDVLNKMLVTTPIVGTAATINKE